MEMTDGIVVTKADGDNTKRAKQAGADLKHALHILSPPTSGWRPEVLVASSLDRRGFDEIWAMVTKYEREMKSSGFFKNQRKEQSIEWFEKTTELLIKNQVLNNSKIKLRKKELEKKIISGKITARQAANVLVDFIF